MRMRRIVFSIVACPALPYFATYLINGTIFGEKVTEHKMGVLISSILSEIFVILRRIQQDITINVFKSAHNVPLLLTEFNLT
jgi:hypothetical protein